MNRLTLKTGPKVVLAFTIAGILGGALGDLISKTAAIVASARIELILASLLALLVYRIVNASGWTFVVRALGGEMNLARGIMIWLFSEAYRWLPGSVWGFLSRAHRAREAGLKKSKAALSVPIELVLTLLAWGFTALSSSLLSGEFTAESLNWFRILSGYVLNYPLTVALSCLLILALCYFLLRQSSTLVLTKLTSIKEAVLLIKDDVSTLELVRVFGLYTGLCYYSGFCFYLCCQALGFENISLSLAIAANANAFIIGFFAVFAPGGLGVREGGLAVMLSPFIGLEAGLASALVWRAIQLFGEILCLAACLLTSSEKASPKKSLVTFQELALGA